MTITALPKQQVAPTPRRLPQPIRPREFGRTDVVLLAGSAISSGALVWVLFYQVTLLSGALGFLLAWYACFLVMYWVATAQVVDRNTATDRVVTAVLCTASAILFGLLVFVILWLVSKAIPHFRWNLLVKDESRFQLTGVKNPLATVGVFHAIVGTLEEVGIAALIGVPLALATAVFLNEVGGRGTRMVRTVVTAMSGTPAVVAGIFIYTILIMTHVMGFSGFAASLALFVILLPLVTRTTEEVLRVVPGGLREASLALGAPEWRTVWSVVLPTARSGVTTAVLLGIARAVGETAPLFFTAFGARVLNADPFHDPQSALPLLIYSNARTSSLVLQDLAFLSGFILMVIVLVLFVLARVLGRTRSKKSGAFASRIFERSLVPTTMIVGDEDLTGQLPPYSGGAYTEPGDDS